MKIQIKCRFSFKVLFECEAESTREAVEKAIKEGADLRGADLRGAGLQGAGLQGAGLQGAGLRGADLRGAYLQGAGLQGAGLRGADLRGAYLQGAYLQGAGLQGAGLQGAGLRGAGLQEIKKDYFERLSKAKNEVLELYKSIMDGKIEGSVYEGECACFCGTIAKIRKENYREMNIDLRPEPGSTTEKWFLGISKGDNPDSNQISAITAEWTREFMNENGIKIPVRKVVWEKVE